ncbi:hypothetical protein [Kitasatospora sp. SUK 42]|uniref:hypothetical protein n=1 Tax=Kitasatospora sp. SUK 42 TaxID=1588882 RepID=UPI0018CB9465|nr:hypothetical protein [Kitasatospora sp. SUK 42]MBV2156473.1 hypothetical protein [Kitasatospora sp. SUK 42]
MKRADAAWVLKWCTLQGFLTVRGVARSAEVFEAEAAVAGVAPGAEALAEYLAGVADVCRRVRSAWAEGSGAEVALVAGLRAADPIGQRWLLATCREYGGETVYRALVAALRTAPVGGTARRRRHVASVRWCQGLHSAGFEDVYELASAHAPGELAEEARQQIKEIADACHRIPYPAAMLAPVRPVLVPRHLGESWFSTSRTGRAWVRERSAQLPYRVPRSIQRTLGLPEPADWGDPLSQADARALVRTCTNEGLGEIGSVAHAHLRGERPSAEYEWPGGLVESEYVVSVASVTRHVRLLSSRRPGGPRMSELEVMARVWAAADEYGRHWLTRCCWLAVGGLASRALSRLAEEYESAAVQGEELTDSGRGVIARWCEDIVRAGLVDIRRLASVTDGPVDWQRITDILSVCYRVPFPPSNRLMASLRYSGRFAKGRSMMSPAGRAWARERSAQLPYRVPRSILRTLEAVDHGG